MMQNERRSVIVSAYSFAPRRGSEPGSGWAMARILAERYDVFVVCAAHYRPLFEEADFQQLREWGIEVVFFDDERSVWLAHLSVCHRIAVRIYYSIWQIKVRSVFKRLIRERRPLFLQHATWGAGTVVSDLTGLGIPVIYGPVGGFDPGCPALERDMGWRVRIVEAVRRVLIRQKLRSKALKTMYEGIDLVLACTADSEAAIRKLGARRIGRMGKVGIPSERIEMLRRMRGNRPPATHVEVLFIGRLLGWKGEELALRAVAAAKNPLLHFTIVGNGPNRQRCVRLADELGIAGQVRFLNEVPQKEIWQRFAESDIFLFPSMHDSGGNVVLEAMASGIPVICLNLGGPAEYVDETCGMVCRATDSEQTLARLTLALTRLADDSGLREALGREGLEKCRNHFNERGRSTQLFSHIDSLLREPS